MDAHCLRHTEIPHTSKLFLDFQYHFDRVKGYYDWWPGNPESYAKAAERIDFPAERRAALVTVLRERNGDSPSLELLAQPGTVAVVTGQQTGLFSGPAYTIYKALSAVSLARQLTGRGIAAVPIFWVATEDHDLAEVNHSYIFGRDRQPVRLQTNGQGEPQQPVGTIALGDPPVEELRKVLEGFPFGEEISAMVAQAYRPDATFGDSFEQLLRSLLGKWGLLFVNPLDHGLRAIAAPMLRNAILRAPELKQLILERDKALEKDGYHAQVHVEPSTSLFFLLEGKRRITLKRQDNEYVSKERRYSTEDLAGRAGQLSPNALLRPVVQDYMLPTAAYVGGPAELAYLAQSQVMYHELLGRMPVVLSRSSFTLLDTRAQKLMTRYGLGLPCFFHGEECLREKIAKKLVPESILEEFAEIEKTTAASLDRLRGNLTAFDATLGAAMDKSRSKILYQLAKMERKAARESLRRDERAAEESRFLSGLIFPEKHLQERFYSILPFLAQHGLGLLDTLYNAMNLECPDHKILAV
jgi:bacillithiol biosynthesis cysteine-adding enzyme BshC